MKRNYRLIPELLFNHYAPLPPYLIASLSPSPPYPVVQAQLVLPPTCFWTLVHVFPFPQPPTGILIPHLDQTWHAQVSLPPVLFSSNILSPLHIRPLIPLLKVIHWLSISLRGSSVAGPCLPKSHAYFSADLFCKALSSAQKTTFSPPALQSLVNPNLFFQSQHKHHFFQEAPSDLLTVSYPCLLVTWQSLLSAWNFSHFIIDVSFIVSPIRM